LAVVSGSWSARAFYSAPGRACSLRGTRVLLMVTTASTYSSV
jgi:hypothetical protein